jgi:argininosuccinate lyase
LVKKGLPFRDAYRLVGELVAKCAVEKTTLEALPLTGYQALSPVFDEGVYEAIDLMACVAQRKTPSGPAPESVKKQIAEAKKKLEG